MRRFLACGFAAAACMLLLAFPPADARASTTPDNPVFGTILGTGDGMLSVPGHVLAFERSPLLFHLFKTVPAASAASTKIGTAPYPIAPFATARSMMDAEHGAPPPVPPRPHTGNDGGWIELTSTWAIPRPTSSSTGGGGTAGEVVRS